MTYINTARIGDASIGSAKIADAAITAAKIEDATITGAKIGTLTVDTINLASGAVTTTTSASIADDTSFVNGDGTRTVSVTLPSYASGAVVVNFTGIGTLPSGGTSGRFYRKFYRKNNTTLADVLLKSATWRSQTGSETEFDLDATVVDLPPSADSYTYRVELSTNMNSPAASYSNVILVASNAKR